MNLLNNDIGLSRVHPRVQNDTGPFSYLGDGIPRRGGKCRTSRNLRFIENSRTSEVAEKPSPIAPFSWKFHDIRGRGKCRTSCTKSRSCYRVTLRFFRDLLDTNISAHTIPKIIQFSAFVPWSMLNTNIKEVRFFDLIFIFKIKFFWTWVFSL